MGEVSANIAEFTDKGLDGYLYKAMSQACALVQSSARSKCPADTGNLRRSIDFEVDEGGKSGTVYSNVEYAPWVEVGTGIHSKKGNGRKTAWRYEGRDGWVTTRGNKAQPFLEPAVTENQSEIAAKFGGLF